MILDPIQRYDVVLDSLVFYPTVVKGCWILFWAMICGFGSYSFFLVGVGSYTEL